MTEQQTPVMTPPAAPPAAPTGPKKKRKGRGKTIAGILIVAAIAIALVVLVWYFVFREDGSKGEVMTDFVHPGAPSSPWWRAAAPPKPRTPPPSRPARAPFWSSSSRRATR